MKMTNKLANTLMNSLACVAFSAVGKAVTDENDDIIVTDEDFQKVAEYARKTFSKILLPWEELMGDEWEFEKAENEY